MWGDLNSIPEGERGFLQAIGTAPDDDAARLVYADWLEERGDGRSEFLRVQVALRSNPPGPQSLALRSREQALRRGLPEYWLTLLDPPVWCIAGNIVDERPSASPGDVPLRGTPLFRPDAKVFFASANRGPLLNPDWWRHDSIEVVGQHRKSRKWIGSYARVRAVRGWLVQLVYQAGARMRLREAGWRGFSIPHGAFDCPPEKGSVEAIEALFRAMDRAQSALAGG